MHIENKTKWEVSDITEAEYDGIVEINSNDGEYHVFELMQTKTKIVFGGMTNIGFFESGYMPINENFSINENYLSLLEDIQNYYNNEETSFIVYNKRM